MSLANPLLSTLRRDTRHTVPRARHASSAVRLRVRFALAVCAVLSAAHQTGWTDTPIVRDIATVREDRGSGWRLREGVFESASFGLRVQATAPWHVAVGAALEALNADAEVGLVCVDPAVWICLISERSCESVIEPLVAQLRGPLEGLCPLPDEPLRVTIGDVPVDLNSHAQPDAPNERLLHGVFRHGEFVYQVLVGFDSITRASALVAVPAALLGIEFLNASEHVELGLELGERPDPENEVNRTSSLRRGVYRDFRFNLTWLKPANRHWRVRTSEERTDDEGNVRLILDEPRLGIGGELTVWVGTDVGLAEAHASGLSYYFDEGGIEANVTTRGTRLGRRRALVSAFQIATSTGSFGFRVVTMVIGRRIYEFVFHGFECNVTRAERDIEAAWKSLVLHPSALESTVSGEGLVRDVRFGFELRAPATHWVRGSEPDYRGPSTTSVTWVDTAGASVCVLAAHVPGAHVDASFPLYLLPDALVEAWGTHGRRAESAGAFKGRPSLIQTFRGTTHTTEVATFWHDRTMYTIAVESPDASLSLADVEDLFEFLP